ncbi:unnamed protein product [Microthlaspi erraticum]|uniref:Reverse transcriptase domain-containing protein n=1 Tax=Microthlaspi erraticum TaxID=1685480 RepID=A0A6D2L4U3_9BRAS|nr:unnamed protein product [Microthlaspi erraticum]
MPRGVNATILSLIPKHKDSQTMNDYRPIACCNFLYKVISKILANRLKLILSDAIEPNQSAFVKGRLLVENVLLASELVNGYHKSSISTRCTIKFDIAKAFDTVKWSFIIAVLQAMGLPLVFINWIHVCISTASFSVVVSGGLEGFFTSARGIRQGCSLSPYLYVILNNVLSKMLNRAASSGIFGYHPQCKEVNFTHLSFADDILVFTDGTIGSLSGVLEVMSSFARISGLYINTSMSSIFAAGQGASTLVAAVAVRGLAVGTLPIRYLGLPLTTKALTVQDYEPLIDKIRSRFISWPTKILSCAGRLQLIKSVIASTVNFWSSDFILPKSCLDTIAGMCSAFLWSDSPHDTHKAKVSWVDLCLPKAEGGLGIRSLRTSSLVFALNLIWRLFSSSGSLWVAWVRHYLMKDEPFWTAKEGSSGSWVWRKLLKMRPLASLFGIHRLARVVEAVNGTSWRLRRQRGSLPFGLAATIRALPIPRASLGEDVVLWKHDEGDYKDKFSSSQTWQQIRNKRDNVSWHRIVWFAQGVQRFSFTVWLAVMNRLSTGDRMRTWEFDQSCLFCGERNETRDHLYFACPYTYTVLLDLGGSLLGHAATPDWEETVNFLSYTCHHFMDSILQCMLFQACIYHIWRERNARRHGSSPIAIAVMKRIIDKSMCNIIASLRYRSPHKLEGLLRQWFAVRGTV